MNVSLRPATPADREAMVTAKYLDPEPEMRAIIRTRRGSLTIGRLLAAAGIELLPSRTTVAELDGRVVGFIETLPPGERQSRTQLGALRVLAEGLVRLGPLTLWRYARLAQPQARIDIDHPCDSHFVMHLDVHPDCRGKGIGALLLAEADRQAAALGAKRLSLTMYITNPAQHLYERSGYRITEERRDAEFEKLTGVPGYCLMLKDLAR